MDPAYIVPDASFYKIKLFLHAKPFSEMSSGSCSRSFSKVCSASVSSERASSLYSTFSPQIIKYFQYNYSVILKAIFSCSEMVFKGHIHISFPSCLMKAEPPRSSRCKRNEVIIGSTCFLPVAGHVTFIDL